MARLSPLRTFIDQVRTGWRLGRLEHRLLKASRLVRTSGVLSGGRGGL
jgi:hypothetical protein